MQCGRVSKHVQMQTVKTALILSRTSSLRGSALGLLVHNDYPHIKCRDRRQSGVYATASTTAKPGMHGMTLGIQAAPGLLRSHEAWVLSTRFVIHAIARESLYACALQSA